MNDAESRPSTSINVVRSFIRDEILKSPDQEIQDDYDLLLSGFLESINVLRLVSFLEEKFNVKIPPEELLPENFVTLKAIDDYVSSKRSI